MLVIKYIILVFIIHIISLRKYVKVLTLINLQQVITIKNRMMQCVNYLIKQFMNYTVII